MVYNVEVLFNLLLPFKRDRYVLNDVVEKIIDCYCVRSNYEWKRIYYHAGGIIEWPTRFTEEWVFFVIILRLCNERECLIIKKNRVVSDIERISRIADALANGFSRDNGVIVSTIVIIRKSAESVFRYYNNTNNASCAAHNTLFLRKKKPRLQPCFDRICSLQDASTSVG